VQRVLINNKKSSIFFIKKISFESLFFILKMLIESLTKSKKGKSKKGKSKKDNSRSFNEGYHGFFMRFI